MLVMVENDIYLPTTSKLSSKCSYKHSVWTSKQVCLNEVCYICKVMDEGEGIVSENGEENFKMVEQTSMFTIALFGKALQKRVWT